jgi:hypothetical protein
VQLHLDGTRGGGGRPDLDGTRGGGGLHWTDPEGVSAIKPYEGFGDVDHTIKELMSL